MMLHTGENSVEECRPRRWPGRDWRALAAAAAAAAAAWLPPATRTCMLAAAAGCVHALK